MENPETKFDLVVIGAGAAGLAAAQAAAKLGARVALVEKQRIGGEYLWSGDVPAQTLIKAARVFDTVKRAGEFGVHIEKSRLIWSAVRLRLEAVRDDIKALEREALKNANIEIVFGEASFESKSTLRVVGKGGERKICAEKFIIAAGSKPCIPAIEGLENIDFLTSEQFFEMRNLPRSWVILGGDAFGCEMAQVLVRFGCKVTLLQSESPLLPREDAEVSAACEKFLRNEGVEVVCNAQLSRAWMENEKKHLEYSAGEETRVVSASEVLVAAGKIAQPDALNLSATGVLCIESGIEISDDLQTAASHIWACGTITGKCSSTHVARAQGEIAAQNALSTNAKKWDERGVAQATFTDPEIARVGLTEEEARTTFGEVEVYKPEFSKLDRAIIDGEANGFLKVVATKGRVIGAHIFGPNASELIHPFAVAVRDEISVEKFAEAICVSPTLSEIDQRAGAKL